MEKQDDTVIEMHCDFVVPLINLSQIWPKLLEGKIFNEDNENISQWQENLSSPETTRDILLAIKRRGIDEFYKFSIILREMKLFDLANTLEQGPLNPLYEIFPNVVTTSVESETKLPLDCGISLSQELDQHADNIDNDENNISEVDFRSNSDVSILDCPNTTSPTINVTRATHFSDIYHDPKVPVYPMRSNIRGYALLLIQTNYVDKRKKMSAIHDLKNLQDVFRQMGFIVFRATDLTGKEIKKVVEDFSLMSEWQHADSCFFIASSHIDRCVERNEPSVVGIDGDIVPWTEICSYFSARNSPALAQKPKVFIFQSCRGKIQYYKTTTSNSDELNVLLPNRGKSKLEPKGGSARNFSHMLIANSPLSGFVPHGDTYIGSWYITILCEVLMANAYNTHIQDIFAMVDACFKNLCVDDNCPTTTWKLVGFNRHMYLNPGLVESPQKTACKKEKSWTSL